MNNHMIIISVKSCWDNNKYIITIIIVNICLFELNKFKVRSLLFKLGSISSLLSVRPWLLTHLVVNMGALKHSLFIAYITSIVWCTLDMSVNVGTMYVRRGTIVEVIPQTALLITCGFSIAMHILVVYMLWRHSIDCKSSEFQQELPIVHSASKTQYEFEPGYTRIQSTPLPLPPIPPRPQARARTAPHCRVDVHSVRRAQNTTRRQRNLVLINTL